MPDFPCSPAPSDQDLDRIWSRWRAGRAREARALAIAHLSQDPDASSACHVAILAAFALGEYETGLAEYGRIDPDYQRIRELDEVLIQAHLHRGRADEALARARAAGRSEAVCAWLAERARRPLEVRLAGTTALPFAIEDPLRDYMPAIPVSLDGEPCRVHLDTGGTFLAASPRFVEGLGVELLETGRGIANARETTVSMGIVERLTLGEAELRNVPIVSLPALEGTALGQDVADMLILGTNVLQCFLATWDNREGRLILSPRGDDDSRAAHLACHGGQPAVVDFLLHGDHYLLVHGTLGELGPQLFFLDTGLVAIDPRGRQAALGVTPSALQRWGLADAAPVGGFLESPGPVSLGSVVQTDHAMHVLPDSHVIARDGLRVEALLSHGFTRHLVWTLDFDGHELLLSAIADPAPQDAPSPDG